MSQNKKAVVILSGGLDSTTLLYDVINQGYDVKAISFFYNQKHQKELQSAMKTCQKLGVRHTSYDISLLGNISQSALTKDSIDIPEGHYEDESMKSTVVPNRNMIFISLATAYAISIKVHDIFIGIHSGDHAIYPDCRPVFFKAMQGAVRYCDYHLVVLNAPYLEMNKIDIIRRGIILRVDYSLTWTCYKGKEKACGKCGSCRERLEAFEKNGIKDPIEYEEK